MKIIYSIIAIIVLVGLLYVLGNVGFFDNLTKESPLLPNQKTGTIHSFETCVEAGYPVMESYPMRCITPEGQEFISPIDNRGPNDDGTFCIQVITPAQNPQTGETREFPTPCDVPEGWEIIQ